MALQEDLCPVYFFIPELYLDSYELENRDAAIKGYIVELKEEVQSIISCAGGCMCVYHYTQNDYRTELSYF